MDHSLFIYIFIDIRERWGRGRYAHGHPSENEENDLDLGFSQKPTPLFSLLNYQADVKTKYPGLIKYIIGFFNARTKSFGSSFIFGLHPCWGSNL